MHIAIFGAGEKGVKLCKLLKNNKDYVVDFFIDNDSEKWSLSACGIKIVSVQNLIDKIGHGWQGKIVVALVHPEPIVEQLNSLNLGVDVLGIKNKYLKMCGNAHGQNIEEILYKIDKGKPRLRYYEQHIAHHCNLNCKGCGHYSNIVDPEFADIIQYTKDVKRLKELFWGVERIRLMGGEPLLNPDLLCDFLEVTYETFPDANLRVVTNGLLLAKTDSKVFEVMKHCGAGFDVSLYQPTKKVVKQAIMRCLENDVECVVSREIERFFWNKYNRDKNDIVENLNNCLYPHCYFLLDGKIAKCAAPILYTKNQKLFEEERNASDRDIIEIHKTQMDGYQLNEVLDNPIDWCQYCSEYFDFAWEGKYRKIL